MDIRTLMGMLIPFVGTTSGAACVLLMKGKLPGMVQKTMLGFAAGVMVAASVWSLLIPAMDMSSHLGKLAFIPAAVGWILGILFLLLLDHAIPHFHMEKGTQEGPKSRWKKSTMLMLAVTIHNIPEGASVGIVMAGAAAGETMLTMTGAIALSVGIAIQNFPEGAIVSLPLKEELGKKKALAMGVLSGVVEPVAALITYFLATYLTPFIPYTLAFAAGAMLYVVVEELIPESAEGEHSNVGTIGFAIGFMLMMILDVALG